MNRLVGSDIPKCLGLVRSLSETEVFCHSHTSVCLFIGFCRWVIYRCAIHRSRSSIVGNRCLCSYVPNLFCLFCTCCYMWQFSLFETSRIFLLQNGLWGANANPDFVRKDVESIQSFNHSLARGVIASANAHVRVWVSGSSIMVSFSDLLIIHHLWDSVRI